MLPVINPANGEKIYEVHSLTPWETGTQLDYANKAYEQWKTKSYAERGTVLKNVAAQLRIKKTEIALLMAQEMGKPIKEGEAEVEKSAGCAEYYADHAEAYLQNEVLPSDASLSYVCFQPLGTILGILPWNAPLWLAFRFCAPALMAGNTCAMKHDPNVPKTAQAIFDAFVAAGAPANILVNLPLKTPDVPPLIEDSRIVGVSFTGSSVAGRKVAAAAGAALKPCVLELGGSDPCIVMADADLEKAADIAVLSRTINAGQSCIAAKRILVEKSIYPAFIDMLTARLGKLKLGDPQESHTDIGPIARKDLRDNLHQQVKSSIDAGANCLLGGQLPEGNGYFYPVTLLTDVTPDMRVFKEETFGPIACVTLIDNAEMGLQLANQTEYGLGAAAWTSNTQVADYFAENIIAGQVAINGIVKTDSRLPSGGVKNSGIGRELGPHGIKEFVNAKQVWIK
jgi:succinate-semialdehyde dehydrogenase/glutarate-semialdehyde dehydrogenase